MDDWGLFRRARACRSRKEKEVASTEKSCVSAGLSYYGLAMVEKVKAPPAPPVPDCGDVDGDGKITAKDALMVLKKAVGKVELTEDQTVVADVDGNNALDAKDALYILRLVVEKIDKFPVQK